MNRLFKISKGAGSIRYRVICCFLAAFFITGALFGSKGPINAETISGGDNEEITVDPTNYGIGYSTVLYDNTSGLPTSEANAIAQTSEGFIWIGSYSGLIRYDGNTFERFD